MKTISLRTAILTGSMVTLASVIAAPPIQTPECGNIDRLSFFSPQMNDSVWVDVWLPDGYKANCCKKYPVVYMHDGQNLYDASTTWNHQSWEIDSVVCAGVASGKFEAPIVVGIHSSPQTRVADLMPEKAVESEPLASMLEELKLHGRPVRGDEYAAFLVETLKPAIDSAYNVMTDRDHTAVMGSSMGGLMSIYSLCEYPDVFGTALCLSTHWIGMPDLADIFSQGLYDYLDKKLPDPDTHRIYFDHGTETIDAYYGPYEEKMIGLVKQKGYAEPGNLRTLVAPGEAHEERSWAKRVEIPLEFWLSGIASK